MDALSPKKIINSLKRNSKFIFSFVVAGFIFGMFYAMIFFKPIYNSVANLLITHPEQTANFNKDSLGNKSLLLTQIEILKSNELAKAVWETVKDKHNLKIDDKKGLAKIKKALHLKNPDNTNIIRITASWNNSRIAKDIAITTVSSYKKLNTKIAQNSVAKNREAVASKLEETEKQLLEVRNEIKNFRKESSLINIGLESQNIVSQIRTLEKDQHTLNSEAYVEAAKINVLAKTLGLKDYNVRKSVITSYTPKFSEKLEILYDELAGLSAKYTESHPAIKKIKSQISRLEKKRQEQLNLTVSKLNNNEELITSDPIKMVMMENLIASESRYTELNSQSQAVEKVLNNLRKKKAGFPEKQFTLVNYTQQENALAEIVNNLRVKQVNAEVKGSEIAANIGIVDKPANPVSCEFPGKFQFVCLFAALSGLLATMFTITREVVRNNYDDPAQIEKDINSPVLGVIPWLERSFYDETDIKFALEETDSAYSLAYQKAISCMRIKGYNSDKRALAFTSTASAKDRSTIIMNTAYALSRTGQSVVVIDADFRKPLIAKELGFEVNNNCDLSDLLTSISKDLKDKTCFDEEKIDNYVQSIPKVDNFAILPNRGNVADPGEYLYSEAFTLLVDCLKKRYDWVLFDVPSAIVVPDAFITGSHVDGMVIVTGFDVNKTVLRHIHRQFNDFGIDVFGVIAREYKPKDPISVNNSIKQMFLKMMPDKEEIMIE